MKASAYQLMTLAKKRICWGQTISLDGHCAIAALRHLKDGFKALILNIQDSTGNNMADCPLCSDILLRHIRSGQTYWLCRRCRLEILEKSYPVHACSKVSLPTISVERSLAAQVSVVIDHRKQPLPSLPTEV